MSLHSVGVLDLRVLGAFGCLVSELKVDNVLFLVVATGAGAVMLAVATATAWEGWGGSLVPAFSCIQTHMLDFSAGGEINSIPPSLGMQRGRP